MARDFMGKTKSERMGFLSNLANNGTDFKTLLGFDDAGWTALVAAVTAQQNAEEDAAAAVIAGTSAVNASNALLNALIVQVRSAANSGRASTMTDAQLAGLGISRRSLNPTPIPVPSVAPAISVQSLQPGVANILAVTPGGAGPRARADGATQIQFSIRESVSVATPEAGIMQSFSKSPCGLNTTLAPFSRVKVVARFGNAKGEFGPWSDPIQFNPQTV